MWKYLLEELLFSGLDRTTVMIMLWNRFTQQTAANQTSDVTPEHDAEKLIIA